MGRLLTAHYRAQWPSRLAIGLAWLTAAVHSLMILFSFAVQGDAGRALATRAMGLLTWLGLVMAWLITRPEPITALGYHRLLLLRNRASLAARVDVGATARALFSCLGYPAFLLATSVIALSRDLRQFERNLVTGTGLFLYAGLAAVAIAALSVGVKALGPSRARSLFAALVLIPVILEGPLDLVSLPSALAGVREACVSLGARL